MVNAPCQFCTERHDLCHAHCEKYLAFQRDRQKYLDERHKANALIGDLRYLGIERSKAASRKAKDNQNRKNRGEHK